MAEIKTKATKESVIKFLKTVQPKEKQVDSLKLLELFKKSTGEKPVMWGSSIVGFGKYHYKSERSTQEGDWFHVGFSPRKQNLTLYILAWKMEEPKELAKLGKYKRGGGCLYINRLSDIDEKILAKLVKDIYLHRVKIHKKQERLRDAEDVKIGVKNGAKCKVIAGTHAKKTGVIQDVHTSKTGHVTITVVQENGDRFKTLARNVQVV